MDRESRSASTPRNFSGLFALTGGIMPHSEEFKQLCNTLRKTVTEIDDTTLRKWIADNKPLHLIDVREADEFAAGHIDNATHISKGWIEAKIHNTASNKDNLIVLYCGGGNRSLLAADNLEKMGYTQVVSLSL